MRNVSINIIVFVFVRGAEMSYSEGPKSCVMIRVLTRPARIFNAPLSHCVVKFRPKTASLLTRAVTHTHTHATTIIAHNKRTRRYYLFSLLLSLFNCRRDVRDPCDWLRHPAGVTGSTCYCRAEYDPRRERSDASRAPKTRDTMFRGLNRTMPYTTQSITPSVRNEKKKKNVLDRSFFSDAHFFSTEIAFDD